MGSNRRRHLGGGFGFSSGRLGSYIVGAFQSLCSFLFDGVDEAINIDEALPLLATTTTGTWLIDLNVIDATPTAIDKIVVFGDTSIVTFIQVEIFTDGKVRFRLFDNNVEKFRVQTDGVAFLDNSWNTIGVVQDAVLPFIMINGIQVAQTLTIGTAPTQVLWFNDVPSLDNGRIACLNGNGGGDVFFFNGYINQVHLLNTNLSAAQIFDWHNNGKPKNAKTLFPTNTVYQFIPQDAYDWDSVNSEWAVPNAVASPIVSPRSFEFDGVNEYFTIPKAQIESVISGSNKTFTQSFTFYKTDDLQLNSIFGDDVGLFYRIDTANKLTINLYNGAVSKTVTWSNVFATATWYTIDVVYDYSLTLGNRVEMYINGVLATKLTDNADTIIGSPTTSFYIGRYSSTSFMFTGYINQTSLTDTALTSLQITEKYNNGNPLNPQTLYGANNKWFFNPDDSGATAQFSVLDSVNSITATSVNLEDADLKYRAPNVSYSVNMEEVDKDCTEGANPYQEVTLQSLFEEYNFTNMWSSENLDISGTNTTMLDYSGEHDLVNPVAANQATFNASSANFNSKPSLTYNGTTDYNKKLVTDWRGSDSTGVIIGVYRTVSGATQYFYSTSSESVATDYLASTTSSSNYRTRYFDSVVASKRSMVGNVNVLSGAVAHVITEVCTGSNYHIYTDSTDNTLTPSTGTDDGATWMNDISRDNISIGGFDRSSGVAYSNIEWCFTGYLPYSDIPTVEALITELKTYYGI
jgi:hypothetical protein